MQLYSFFNSSTSYRVRIALALKGLAFDTIPVNIRAGEHRAGAYVDEVNPSASVPALIDGEIALGQSLAILDYLDAKYPEPRLVPQDIEARARVLELAMLVSCDMHPVNNLRILKYLQGPLGLSAEQKNAWYRHWVDEGMASVERLLGKHGHGAWCFGDAPTLADVCLIPQIANARRMGCDLSAYPRAMAVYALAETHPAFRAAAPNRQPDYTA
ncbi:maleylacetoacetate isomerase [Pandoraea cepalis]|uniref:Maleylacetoacetate isomerase n=1 Tax=Pandoraea cepalis TaxID=2508294 RepID=A0AAW7MS50_9BURK|nr:maleylacetoacetate isomerase [Pandoraea cepalis]MDN4575668.1 maleylacetoacetate isomerase [Pandoraea cepalis]MDN4580770.1 maleylacetoacetate isomerase [Pandoraea cepalis]